MKLHNLLTTATLVIGLTVIPVAQSDSQNTVATLSSTWMTITYDSPADKQLALLKTLHNDAESALKDSPENPELLSWAGIITASYAGAKGGLGALKLAKKARSQLERAISIDPEALAGGARTSLGALYYQVPPWPVGFGNSDKARKLLHESYVKHPDNLDVLFFYGDFLLRQKQYTEAQQIFIQAAKLPPRANRLLADNGRQQQIKRKLAKIQ